MNPVTPWSNAARLFGQRWMKVARGFPIVARAIARPAPGQALLSPNGTLIQIENTNYCNFRCSYCPTHSPNSSVEKPSRGHMSIAHFGAVLDAHPRARLAVIQGQGEPLMDPTLFDKIDLARQRRILTQVISNGSLLTDAMRERLWAAGPDVLLFSIDSTSPEGNESARRGLRFFEVMDRIRFLTGGRKQSSRSMIVGLLSIVHGPFDDDVQNALLRFNDLGIDLLLYKQLNASFENRIRGYRAPSVNGVPRTVQSQLNYIVSHQRVASVAPCAQVRFDWPYYLWDGTRTACCVLNDKRYGAEEFSRPTLLRRFKDRCMPGECERCSFFTGYPS